MASAGDMVLGEDMALEGDTGLEGACLMQGLYRMIMLEHLWGQCQERTHTVRR